MIVDWDYHHGNATQDMFYNDNTVLFFSTHDPTQLNGQGNDIGTQYRSIILTENVNELPIINQTKQKYQETLKAQSKGVLKTEIGVLSKFFLAFSTSSSEINPPSNVVNCQLL